jgi:hypothetical protein
MEINPATLWERTLQKRVQNIFKKSFFDLDAYDRLRTEINTLKGAIQHYEITLLK